MKRLLLGLFCAVLLGVPGPLPVASAQGWWHHKGPGPAGAGSEHNAKKAKAGREKHPRAKQEPLYKSPKTVGWWHKGPGPAGAGVK
jgi:hypothetical protein